jgi:hypothetical protein
MRDSTRQPTPQGRMKKKKKKKKEQATNKETTE